MNSNSTHSFCKSEKGFVCLFVINLFVSFVIIFRHRKKPSWSETFSGWIWNPSYDEFTEGTLNKAYL